MDNNTTDYDPNWGGLANDDDGLPPPTSFGLMDYEEKQQRPTATVVATPVTSQPTVVASSVATVIATAVPGTGNTGPYGRVASDSSPHRDPQQDKEAKEIQAELRDGDKFWIFMMNLFSQRSFGIFLMIVFFVGHFFLGFEALIYFDVIWPYDFFLFDMIRWVYWPS